MKYIKHKVRSGVVQITLISMLLSLGACNTSPVKTTGYTLKGEGIPYHLPKSIQMVELKIIREQAEYQDLVINVSPILVPDRSRLFYLKSNVSPTFTTDHKFYLDNGMLSSVDTIDEGQIGELALSVVDSISELGKLVISGAQSGDDSAFLTIEGVITAEEIDAALKHIRGDQFVFSFDGLSSNYALPGTDGMLEIDSKVIMPSKNFTAGIVKDQDKFSGIYAKSLTHATVDNRFRINGKKVLEKRKKEFQKAIAEYSEAISNIDTLVEKAVGDAEQSCIGIPESDKASPESIATAILDFNDASEEKILRYKTCEEKIKERDAITQRQDDNPDIEAKAVAETKLASLNKICLVDQDLKVIESIILIPDPDRDVRIPIKRAPIGKTTNNITLTHGVLTSYKSVRPAVAVEIAKSAEKVLKGIVSIPGELVQFKIDQTGKDSELLAKQAELLEKQRNLEDQLDKLEGTQKQTTNAERDLALLIKQNELENTSTAQQIKTIDDKVKLIESQSKLGTASQLSSLSREAELLAATLEINKSRIEILQSEKELLEANDPKLDSLEKEISYLEKLEKLHQKQIDILNLEIEQNSLQEQATSNQPNEPNAATDDLNFGSDN